MSGVGLVILSGVSIALLCRVPPKLAHPPRRRATGRARRLVIAEIDGNSAQEEHREAALQNAYKSEEQAALTKEEAATAAVVSLQQDLEGQERVEEEVVEVTEAPAPRSVAERLEARRARFRRAH